MSFNTCQNLVPLASGLLIIDTPLQEKAEGRRGKDEKSNQESVLEGAHLPHYGGGGCQRIRHGPLWTI